MSPIIIILSFALFVIGTTSLAVCMTRTKLASEAVAEANITLEKALDNAELNAGALKLMSTLMAKIFNTVNAEGTFAGWDSCKELPELVAVMALELDLYRSLHPAAASAGAAPTEKSFECWSADEEDFNCTSLGELIDRFERLKPGDTVWRAAAVTPALSRIFDADDAMEQMRDRAGDIAGEYADDYPNVTNDQRDELGALIHGWIAKNAPPTFWSVENARPYVLTQDDFAAEPAPVEAVAPAAAPQGEAAAPVQKEAA